MVERYLLEVALSAKQGSLHNW